MNDALSWADASADCQAAGLQLASVQSAAQNVLLLTAAAGNMVWIGGTDAESEGAWVWSPSNTPLSYTNWQPSEPSNSGGAEHYLEFNHRTGGSKYWAPGRWNCQERPELRGLSEVRLPAAELKPPLMCAWPEQSLWRLLK